MAKLTEVRNTPELHTGGVKYHYERTAGSEIFAGAIAAQNAEGLAVPAADAPGLVVLGRAENSAGAAEKAVIKKGTFLFENGEGSETLTVADIGADCFIVDDQTVGKIGGTNKVKAGVVLDVTPDGVAVII